MDLLLNILGALALNGAADRDGSAEDFHDGSLEISCKGLGAHFLGDFNDLIHGDFAVVENVLGLLSVASRFFKSFEDQGTSSVHDADFALLVLDLDLDLDLDALPVLGGFLDVFTDLLRGHTDGRALGCEGSSRSDFTTDNLHKDVVDCVRVKGSFGRHSILFLPIY